MSIWFMTIESNDLSLSLCYKRMVTLQKWNQLFKHRGHTCIRNTQNKT